LSFGVVLNLSALFRMLSDLHAAFFRDIVVAGWFPLKNQIPFFIFVFSVPTSY